MPYRTVSWQTRCDFGLVSYRAQVNDNTCRDQNIEGVVTARESRRDLRAVSKRNLLRENV